jgi:prevent-host-death family protein
MKKKSYSIAAARDSFPSLVRAAEGGVAIELTRRGKPIAVLVALADYERLTAGRRGFRENYQDFLRRNPDFAVNAVEPEDWLCDDRGDRNGRDPSGGRDFSW